MKKKNKNEGILFWITGLSGSGKSSIAKSIKKEIVNKYGPTLNFSGDDLRKIFDLNKYDKASRLKYCLAYSNFCKEMVKKKINLIFTTIAMFHKVRKLNKRHIKNYVEIYIKSDIEKLIKKRKKIFYRTKLINIVGKNIRAEFPLKPDITINNDFNRSIFQIKKELIKKINKII